MLFSLVMLVLYNRIFCRIFHIAHRTVGPIKSVNFSVSSISKSFTLLCPSFRTTWIGILAFSKFTNGSDRNALSLQNISQHPPEDGRWYVPHPPAKDDVIYIFLINCSYFFVTLYSV